MFTSLKSSKKASSRGQIAIKGAQDNILLLPGEHYRAVLEVSPLNFELKSEAEQDAIIETYESFLNSLAIPLQIVIRTRQIDMDKYLMELSKRLENEALPVYREQLQHYNEFIRGLIQSNKILTHHFYIVIPYDHTAKGKSDFILIKEQLALSVDIVAKSMHRLGIQTRQLSSLEILELFYSFYNPTQAKIQPLTERALRAVHRAVIQTEGDKHA